MHALVYNAQAYWTRLLAKWIRHIRDIRDEELFIKKAPLNAQNACR
jgi:hypothetical protein